MADVLMLVSRARPAAEQHRFGFVLFAAMLLAVGESAATILLRRASSNGGFFAVSMDLALLNFYSVV